MENNIERFNLSEDLKQIFGVVFELSRQNDQYEISIDAVISAILCKYVKVESDEYLEKIQSFIMGSDKLLEGYFETLSEETREKIIGVVNEVMDQDIKSHKNKWGSIFKSSHHDDSIVLSEGLDFLLKRLEARYEHEEITAFDFFLSAGIDPIESEVMKRLKSEVGITYDVLSAYKMANKLAASIMGMGGELKEKTVSYSDDDNEEDDKESKKEEARKRLETDDREFEMAGGSSGVDPSASDPNSDTPFLDMYSTDLSKQCREGRFDPIVGREKEISQLIEVLSCRKKKNGILTGSPGAGKSSIVVGLAQAIESGNVPRELKGKIIRSVDIMAMVSGSTFRGDFEKRLLSTANELVNHPEIIAFIDEIHNIVGAGSNSDGKGDAGALLKPYLSGTAGDISVIGAATSEEYRKFIESDGALKRRFQEILVEEPNVEQTIEILTKVSQKYEEFHRVKYTPEIIENCVKWSDIYINDISFPDKAITVLDMCGALAKLKKVVDMSSVENLEKSIDSIVQEKISLVESCDFEEAQKRRDLENTLTQELNKEKEKIDQQINDPSNWPEVTIEDVASIISKMSKIPIDKIRQTSFEKLKAMRESMEKTVIGQEQAIKEISTALNRQFLGLKDCNKPISCLEVGVTGSGKSYLAKIIAKELFGTEKALIRIDCSLYTSETGSSSLLGANQGYIGYGSKTVLHEIKKRPFSVVLFDEIEKMNPEIINTLFLPLLDEGEITLSDGEKINFRNTIVIFSSNIGTKEVENKTYLGFGGKLSGDKKQEDDKETVMKAIRKKLRPELIGRIGSIIFFNSLGIEELKKIFDLEIKKLEERLGESGFTLEVSQEAKDYIVSKCDLRYGARDLNKQIVTYVENEISNSLIEQSDPNNIGKHIIVGLNEDNTIKVLFNSVIIANVVNNKEKQKA